MKVKCIINKLSRIKSLKIKEWLKPDYINLDDDEIIGGLEIGKVYTVYGITFWDNTPFFYICDGEYDDYPTPEYSGLFEIVDERLSKYFLLSSVLLEDNQANTSLVFNEWAKNQYFYEKLLDGEENEVAIFEKYKKLLKNEFPDDNIQLKGLILEDNWIMCPECDESWQSNESSAMVNCPSCWKRMHNPYFTVMSLTR